MGAPHLDFTTSARGFVHLPSVPSVYGGRVTVWESSLAEGPHIWLGVTCPADFNDPDGPEVEAVAHLTAEDALRLADQLRFLVEHHYQGHDRAAPAQPIRIQHEGDLYGQP